ncbi:hypothetical protein CGRA01v4_08611 [Colletotrichum graminicola]|nr:hypothetical protein CGRA01v4_08611 [Colletotrichum graminicola]
MSAHKPYRLYGPNACSHHANILRGGHSS